jgi:hypothetical protein
MAVGFGDRPLTIQPEFPLWIDCHPDGGVHRAALPLVNSSPLSHHVDHGHSGGPWGAPRICR